MPNMKISERQGLSPQLRDALVGNSTGLLFGAGTSSSFQTVTQADAKFLSFYLENKATSGDNRGVYLRFYLSGAGGGGESARFYTTVNNVAAGTAHGAHIAINFGTTGSVTGQAAAVRATLEVPNGAVSGGTYSAGLSEIYNDGNSSDISGATAHAIHRFIVAGGDATAKSKIQNVFSFEGLGSTALAAAGTGANSAAVSTGGVASKVIRVLVDGTVYYMPLFSSNA